jgi:hypothetical protein
VLNLFIVSGSFFRISSFSAFSFEAYVSINELQEQQQRPANVKDNEKYFLGGREQFCVWFLSFRQHNIIL